MLSYLIVNDLPAEFNPQVDFYLTTNFHRPSAKFALLRLPDAVASLPTARALLNLFASVWERRYENVYSRGEALFNLAQQGDSSHTEVAGVFTSLVTAFIGKCGVLNLPMLHCYASSRVFPPTDNCIAVKSIYNHPPRDNPSIPRFTSRGTSFLYVAYIMLDYDRWLRTHSPQLKSYQKRVGISMPPPM